MDNSTIGTQITKFRKAAGITQEELGRAVGVSTQAVSRWECGGAPDVTLLPAIAEKLGVTIDALFGREGGEVADINELVRNYFKGVPKEQYHDKLNRLVWNGAQGLGAMRYMPYLDQCTDETGALIGGCICPGVKISMDALTDRTALLPGLQLDQPKKVIGRNTIDCMRSGIMMGNACMLDGMVERMEAELGRKATVIATGGIAKFIIPMCKTSIIYDKDLLVKGLAALYRDNKRN